MLHWAHVQYASPSHNAQTTPAQPNLLRGTWPDWAQAPPRWEWHGRRRRRRRIVLNLACACGFQTSFTQHHTTPPVYPYRRGRRHGVTAWRTTRTASQRSTASHLQTQGLPRRYQPRLSRATRGCCPANPAVAEQAGCHAKPPVCGPSGRRRRREPTVWRAVRTAFQRSTGEQRGSCATLRSSSSTAASTLPRCSSIRPHACGRLELVEPLVGTRHEASSDPFEAPSEQ